MRAPSRRPAPVPPAPPRRRAAPLAALLAIAFAAAWSSGVDAHPVPTIHPGGTEPAPDSITIDFPVRLAPSLLSLRSLAPFWLGGPDPAAADTVSLVRGFASTPARSRAAPVAGGDAISFSGTKTVSVEVGRGRDASLQQSLDLTLRGRIGGDVEVAATLSDQNLPFQPDGTSRELADLDRVSISVRAPRGEATMGDFVLEGMPGQFGRVSRHLQGVRGAVLAGGARWNVAAAGAKGDRRTVEFRGEEGRQGPYPLMSRGLGAASAGVVAGSEIVWLDGARLRRGADADYVVDYGAGAITFTIRFPITFQSRIAVDFEAAASRYQRNFYAATTQGSFRGAGTYFASYMREGDDAGSPVAGDLTQADRDALGQIGDSAAVGLPTGVRYVGPGQGSYAWDLSDAAHPHWFHLGPGRGEYEVGFTDVGPARGAYVDTTGSDGLRFYVYRGENLGPYAPGRAVAVPSSKMLLDVGGAARVFGTVGLEAELARSGFDRNSLSGVDDGDNGGTAARVVARLDPRALTIGGARWGTVRASVSMRSQNDRFVPFDRVDPAFEGERWNQRDGVGGEDRQELAVQYEPRGWLSLSADLGRRSLSGGSRSWRRAAQAALSGPVGGAVYWEIARNSAASESGRRSRWGLDLGRQTGRVLPRVVARQERIEGQEGDSADSRQSQEISIGLQYLANASLRIRSGYSVRTDGWTVTAGGPTAEQQATTFEGGVTARAGAALSLEAGVTRRRVGGDGGPVTTDLAQLAILAGRPGSAVTSELRYDVTQLREAALVRELVPVAPGSGSYDGLGNAKWGGGYELISSVGDPETRSRAVVQWRLDAYPGRAASAARASRPVWRGFGMSSFLRVETLSTLPLGRVSHAVDPDDYLAAGTTVRGFASARQTLEYSPPSRRYDARAELGLRRERNGETRNLESLRDAVDVRLGLRYPLPGRLRAQASVTADRGAQSVRRVDTGEGVETVVRGRGVELEISRQLSAAWSVSLLSQQRRNADMTHGGTLDFWSAGPTAHGAAGARLRFDGRVLWGQSVTTGLYLPPGLYLVPPGGSRIDYDLLGEYRLRERISFSLGWNGIRSSSAPAYYAGRFELRGSF